MRTLAMVALLAALIPPGAASALDKYDVDHSHTTIGFAVRHMGISTVRGKFTDYDAVLMLDEKDLTKSTVFVTIKTASIDTDHEKRDAHLKSPDFFDAEKHPEITFKSTKIEKSADGYVVTGDLTMRGVTKPITKPVQVVGPVKGMGGRMLVGVGGETKINRQDFGVSWSRTLDQGGLVVGNDVTIEINAEFVQPQEAPPAK